MEEDPAKFKRSRNTSIALFTLMCAHPRSPAFPKAGLLSGAASSPRIEVRLTRLSRTSMRGGYLVRTFDARPDRGHTARPFIPRL